ncbi:hypothetical protein NGRA_0522 [Nosema granulosis]|uniref:Uncharacterized protein n=1 Tax=Nosema granulosis TaxID=83296 RepID=A0A9P6H068_9MICR|nr:hypothetical protein NGRA_0522 [Nosema granulosis]
MLFIPLILAFGYHGHDIICLLTIENFADEITETYMIRDGPINSKNYKNQITKEIVKLNSVPIITTNDLKIYKKLVPYNKYVMLSHNSRKWYLKIDRSDVQNTKTITLALKTANGEFIYIHIDDIYLIKNTIKSTFKDTNIKINAKLNRISKFSEKKEKVVGISIICYMFLLISNYLLFYAILKAILFFKKNR